MTLRLSTPIALPDLLGSIRALLRRRPAPTPAPAPAQPHPLAGIDADFVSVSDAETALETVEREYAWTRQQVLDNLDSAEIMISNLDACALLVYTDMLAAGIDQDVAWPIMADLFKNLNTLEEPKAEEGGLGVIALYEVASDGTITPVDPEEGEA